MNTIEPYKATNGYSQPTMTPPPTTSNESMDYEGIGHLYVENNDLKKRIKELESENSETPKYKELYCEKCKEYDELKSEYKLVKEENKQLKQQLKNDIPHSYFQYNYDMMDFNDKMESSDIERLMNLLLELAETPLPRGYLIKDSMDLVPIYIVLAERNTFTKHGNLDNDTKNWGITILCDCWNNNVVPRIADTTRRDELRCDSDKIKKELGRDWWKNAASCSWRSLYDSIDNINGRASKKKAKLGRAVNIQRRLEKQLEQIPALKSKKY